LSHILNVFFSYFSVRLSFWFWPGASVRWQFSYL
jgi:hypothetical protein